MAKLKDLKVTIGLSKKGLTKLNADLRRTKSNFRRNFGEIAGMAKNAALAIGTTLVAAVSALIKSGADMERLETSFRSIMGGAEGAAKMVGQLNKFAADTPFQLESISRAARQLLAVGTGQAELNNQLKMLGDIAAASGNQIEDIAAIFAKVQAKGKVELENLNQLAERGIPIFDQLRQVTGDANMEFGAGAVSVEEFNDALKNMVTQGGFANGAMQNLSTTTHGLFSTLKDNLNIVLAQTADKLGVMDHVNTKLTLAIAALKGATEVTSAEVSVLKDEFSALMNEAAKPTQDNIDQIENGFKALGTSLKRAKNRAKEGTLQYKQLSAMLSEVARNTHRLNQAVLAGLPEGEKPKPKLGPTRPQDMAAAMSISATTIQNEINEKMLQPLLNLGYVMDDIALNKTLQMEQAQVSMAYSLAGAFNSVFDTLLNNTQNFGQMMADIVQRLVVQLFSMLAAFAAITALTGGATGTFALEGFLRGGFGIPNIPQMASGGLFTGRSLAMVGEGPGTSMINPEVVAPLDKLQQMIGGGAVTVTGRLDGRDILLSSERAGFDRSRVRGF